MRPTIMLAALGFSVALGSAQAQVPGTNLGTPQSQPQPGGGVATGPGAPTSAERNVAGSNDTAPRGAPPAGSGAPVRGGDPSNSTLAPSGAIRPGSSATGGTGGGGGGSAN